MELTAREIAAVTGGELLDGDPAARATSVTIDSRRLDPGACFVALRGARDGHDFVADAFHRGATVAIVERPVHPAAGLGAVVRVPDSLAALGTLGRLARSRLHRAVVVGITGSAGKTATKDLTAAALRTTHAVHASPESFNNEAGVPLTLLGAPDHTEVIVTEMGARFEGNIAELASLANPSIGVVTHVGLAHAGHLGGREGIARVKGELLEALPPDGVAILNAGCDSTPGLEVRTAARIVRVGRSVGAHVRASAIVLDEQLRPRFRLETDAGSALVSLELRGEHQVENALQAAAVALELGVPLESVVEGLADARAAALRMEVLSTSEGVLVINDAYNSSPTSAAAAIRSLARLEVEGRRIAVLGEMLELGDDTVEHHAALGTLAAELEIDVVIAVGEPAEHLVAGAGTGRVTIATVADPAEAALVVAAEVRRGDAVLVKASRAVGLERVAHALTRGAALR